MDPVTDMFIRIKNAQKAGHDTVQIPHSKFKYEIAKVLERAGYVKKVERKGKRVRKILAVTLLYKEKEPAISQVRFISRPSQRFYRSYKDVKSSPHGGVVILSTSKGVMTSIEAKKEKVGGQLIAEIW